MRGARRHLAPVERRTPPRHTSVSVFAPGPSFSNPPAAMQVDGGGAGSREVVDESNRGKNRGGLDGPLRPVPPLGRAGGFEPLELRPGGGAPCPPKLPAWNDVRWRLPAGTVPAVPSPGRPAGAATWTYGGRRKRPRAGRRSDRPCHHPAGWPQTCG